MGNLLEKITLYDILGYTLPGCVLLLLLLGMDTEYVFIFLGEWNDHMGVLYFLFFLAAYLSGIVLSELADTAIAIRKKVKPPAPAKWERDAGLSRRVARALKKSGYCEAEGTETEETIANTIAAHGLEEYMGYIYGSIQIGTEYRRLHDYASAYVLYKNLAAAFVIGTGVLFVSKGWNFGILISGVILAALMIKRSIHFCRTKNKYAVVWFLDKMR